MASLYSTSRINIVHTPANKRYLVSIRDYKRGLTIGLEPLEALQMCERLLTIAAEYEMPEAVETMNRVFDALDSKSVAE